MTLRDIGNIGDGVRPGRATARHRYRRSIYIILVSKNESPIKVVYKSSKPVRT